MPKIIIKYARTKSVPARDHPAQYRGKKGDKIIEFVVFTHAKKITVDDEKVQTKELAHSVTKEDDKNKGPSRVSPVVYVGERGLLGKNSKKIKVHEDDKKIVNRIFKKGKRKKL